MLPSITEPRLIFPVNVGGWLLALTTINTFSPLKYAVNDARAVGSKLQNLGFDEVIFLENEKATKSGIERTLNGLANDVGPDDTVVVFFAGHGNTLEMPNGSRMGYWIPVDGDVDQEIATGISMETIRLLSQVIPAKYLLYLIDACYSGLALRQTWPGEGDKGFCPANNYCRTKWRKSGRDRRPWNLYQSFVAGF